MRLTYVILYALFGMWWTPYGVFVVFTHGLLAASVGIFVYGSADPWLQRSPSRSRSSHPRPSSGVITSFIYATLYVVVSLMLLSAVLVDLFVKRRSLGYALLTFLAITWCSFTIISGTPIYMIVFMFYVGLKLAVLRSVLPGNGMKKRHQGSARRHQGPSRSTGRRLLRPRAAVGRTCSMRWCTATS